MDATVATPTAGRHYYTRAAFRWEATPSSNGTIFQSSTAASGGGTILWSLDLTSADNFRLKDQGGSTLASVAASTSTWFVIEIHWMIPTTGSSGNITVELKVDGDLKYSSTTVQTALRDTVSFLQVGNYSGVNRIIRVDDFALNDDQGASVHTTWCGHNGKIVLLKPVADIALDSWLGGAGGGSNIFGAVDNTPPTGAAVGASSTDSTQIEDTANNSTDEYEATLAKYTDSVASGGGGMASTDVPVYGRYIARGGYNGTTSRTLGVRGISNPDSVLEATGGSGTTAAAAEPTGWTTIGAGVNDMSGVALGTAPTMKVRKGTATTVACTYDFMGLMVEYAPLLTQAVPDTLSLSDSLVKKPVVQSADTVSLSDSLVKKPVLNKADTAALADALVKKPVVKPADTLSVADAVSKGIGVGIADTATLAEALSKVVVKPLADNLALNDALFKFMGLTVNDSVGLADALRQGLQLKVEDTLALSDVLSKAVTIRVNEVLSAVDLLDLVNSKYLAIADSITLADALAKSSAKPLSDSVGIADVLSLRPSIRLADSIGLDDSLAKSFGKGIADSIGLADLLRLPYRPHVYRSLFPGRRPTRTLHAVRRAIRTLWPSPR
jgi:hypothetical protein